MTDFNQGFQIEGLGNNEEEEITTPEESSPETKETETAPSQEGEEPAEVADTPDEPEAEPVAEPEVKDVPLNKDIRWQEKLAQEQRFKDTITEQKEMIDKLLASKEPSTEGDIPEQFLKVFGSGDSERDKTAWKEYKNLLDLQKETILGEIKQQQEQEGQRVNEWNTWVKDQVSLFQEQGRSISEQEFTEIIQEFEPSNGLKSYDAAKVAKIHDMKKELAALKISKETDKDKEKAGAKKANAALGSSPTKEDKETFTLDDSPLWARMFNK